MRAARIEVLIDRLVVDGAQLDAPEQLGWAVQQELARLLQGAGAGAGSGASSSVEAQIARAIHERIGERSGESMSEQIGERIGGAQESASGVKANKETR